MALVEVIVFSRFRHCVAQLDGFCHDFGSSHVNPIACLMHSRNARDAFLHAARFGHWLRQSQADGLAWGVGTSVASRMMDTACVCLRAACCHLRTCMAGPPFLMSFFVLPM